MPKTSFFHETGWFVYCINTKYVLWSQIIFQTLDFEEVNHGLIMAQRVHNMSRTKLISSSYVDSHSDSLFLLSLVFVAFCERVPNIGSLPSLIFMKHNTLSLSQCFDGLTTKGLLPIQLWFEWAQWMNNTYIFPCSTLCQQKVWVIIKVVVVRNS